MGKDPAALLYIDKWIVATTEMKADARGYYMDLILHQFDSGDLPNDIEELANICRVRFSEFDKFKQVFEQVLKHKFEINSNNRLEQSFAREIIQKRQKFIEKRSLSGKISYVSKFAKKQLKMSEKEILIIKEHFDFDSVDLKNEQVLEQVLKQTLELYINEDVIVDENKDLIINVINLLNHYCDTSFKPESDNSKRFINARIREGFTLDDFKAVILFKKKEWYKTDQHQYLRPQTLFGTKFESYLNGAKLTPEKPEQKQYLPGIDPRTLMR